MFRLSRGETEHLSQTSSLSWCLPGLALDAPHKFNGGRRRQNKHLSCPYQPVNAPVFLTLGPSPSAPLFRAITHANPVDVVVVVVAARDDAFQAAPSIVVVSAGLFNASHGGASESVGESEEGLPFCVRARRTEKRSSLSTTTTAPSRPSPPSPPSPAIAAT